MSEHLVANVRLWTMQVCKSDPMHCPRKLCLKNALSFLKTCQSQISCKLQQIRKSSGSKLQDFEAIKMSK